MTEDQIYKLGTNIAEELFPEETLMFEVCGKQIISDTLNGNMEKSKNEQIGFEFGEGVLLTMNTAIAVVSLCTAVIQLRSASKDNSDSSIQIFDLIESMMLNRDDFPPETIKKIIDCCKKHYK